MHTPQCIPLQAIIFAQIAPEPGAQQLVPNTFSRDFGALAPGQAFVLVGFGFVVFETDAGDVTMTPVSGSANYFVAPYPVKNVRVDAFAGQDCWGHFAHGFAAWMPGGDGRYSRGQ